VHLESERGTGSIADVFHLNSLGLTLICGCREKQLADHQDASDPLEAEFVGQACCR
jgi:hypothetical protein